ncbi:MAG: hypothetical protein ACR2MK_05605 [Solirubrobacteraceae bacterium]
MGLERPVVQAGMGGGVAGGELAGAVSAAGGLGTVGMRAPRRRTQRPARRRPPARDAERDALTPTPGFDQRVEQRGHRARHTESEVWDGG